MLCSHGRRALTRVLPHFGGSARYVSTRPVVASALVRGEADADSAANKVAESLLQGLDGKVPSCTLWFAKGYGARAAPLGPLLQDRLGGAVVGSSSEGGVIGASEEVQAETFAVSALSLAVPNLDVYPFHTPDFTTVPELGRDGNWARVASGGAASCVIALGALPIAPGCGDPQGWAAMLDRALFSRPRQGSLPKPPPLVVGGLLVSSHVFVDGQVYQGGGFGLALHGAEAGVRFDSLVSQGAVPFGPFLEITGVLDDCVVTELDGKNPQEVLEPIVRGPSVPGSGLSMAGVFVNPAPDVDLPWSDGALAHAALDGRPSCLVRPMHHFTPQGHLVLSPLTKSLSYARGMQLQLHCYSADHALQDLRDRAENDAALRGGTVPDAAVMVMCGARGSHLYHSEGVESRELRKVWGRDVPTVGFFAGGEFGPVGLKTYIHSYTTSCLTMRLQS